MRAQMQLQSERLARGPAHARRARIDPIVYLAEGRRRQAQAMAEAIAAGSRAVRWGLTSVARVVRQWLVEPLARRTERRRAIGRLAELDDRLLADIGLRRGDIALAVDGLLADPRVTRPVPATQAQRLRDRAPMPAAPANSNQQIAAVKRVHIRDRAA